MPIYKLNFHNWTNYILRELMADSYRGSAIRISSSVRDQTFEKYHRVGVEPRALDHQNTLSEVID